MLMLIASIYNCVLFQVPRRKQLNRGISFDNPFCSPTRNIVSASDAILYSTLVRMYVCTKVTNEGREATKLNQLCQCVMRQMTVTGMGYVLQYQIKIYFGKKNCVCKVVTIYVWSKLIVLLCQIALSKPHRCHRWARRNSLNGTLQIPEVLGPDLMMVSLQDNQFTAIAQTNVSTNLTQVDLQWVFCTPALSETPPHTNTYSLRPEMIVHNVVGIFLSQFHWSYSENHN